MKNKMKSKKYNFYILIIAVLLVLYFSLKDDFLGVIKTFSKVNLWIIFLAVILYLISLLFKSISLKVFIREYYKDYSVKDAYSITLMGQFFNGITPFQSGGQPFQVYFLKKEGKKVSDCINAMLKDSLAYQIALVLIGTITIIINFLSGIYKDNSLNFLVFMGFIVNFIVFLVFLLIIAFKKTGLKIINNIIDFIFNIRLIGKFNAKKDLLKKWINDFYKTSKEIRKNKKEFLIGIICHIINLFMLYLVPYVVLRAFGVTNISLLNSFIATSFVMLISNFIPIPGATGGIEYGFYKFFGYYIGGAILTSSMLMWRFITYAFGMIIGFIILICKKGVNKK